MNVPAAPVIVSPQNRDRLLAGAPFSFRLVCNIAARLKFGALIFVLPDRPAIKFVGPEDSTTEGVIVVKDYAFARRTLLGGDTGFFESFADDQWDSPDIATCLYVLARNVDFVHEAFLAMPLISWADRLRHALHRNTRAGAARNISAHYDLGNAFYEKWLDPSMTYSSAVFPEPASDLGSAQNNKYRVLAERIGLHPDEHVLEIGCGWGGFAEYAAKTIGANVTGLTISKEQFDYARKRMFDQGLNEKVDVQLIDYRDVDGQFDKVASIEMFEAVGKEYWPAYFSKIRDVLKPGGVAGLQVITIADRLFEGYARSIDFIRRYVFPGGMLPSPTLFRAQIETAGLAFRQAATFGGDYARTLNEWHQRFLREWNDIQPMGFDDRFKKLWRFYLAYCEAGFRAGTTDVQQTVLQRPA